MRHFLQTRAASLALVLLTICTVQARAQNAGPPPLEGVSSAERTMIEAACSLDRNVGGPARYYNCLRSQLSALRSSSGPPSLASLSSAQRAMVESACSLDRNVGGPARYYNCLRNQVAALDATHGEPSLVGVSSAERAMIESACSLDRNVGGPARYYNCLRNQLSSLHASSGPPSLAGLSTAEEEMIEAACSLDRNVGGPARYYNCIRRQLAALGRAAPGGPQDGRASQQALRRHEENSPAQQTLTDTRAPDSNSIHKDRPHTASPKQSKPTDDIRKTQSVSSVSGAVESSERSPKWMPPATQNIDPKRNPSTAPNSDGLTLARLFTFVIGAVIIFFLFRKFHSLRYKDCVHCRRQFQGQGNMCVSCVAALQEEARRAREQRYTEERAKEEERRRQREEAEEEQRRRMRTIADLNKLTGYEFEELIASLFNKDGYSVRRCGGSGDEGVDLILEIGESRDVVQCKRWKADVGSPVVRDFYGALMHANARHGFIITSASFSPSARSFALRKPITLISGNDLIAWIGGTYTTRSGDGRRARAQENARSETQDPYFVLGISHTAGREEIRAAYRREMAKYHPDKVSHLGRELQELANQKAQDINNAYEQLMHSTATQ